MRMLRDLGSHPFHARACWPGHGDMQPKSRRPRPHLVFGLSRPLTRNGGGCVHRARRRRTRNTSGGSCQTASASIASAMCSKLDSGREKSGGLGRKAHSPARPSRYRLANRHLAAMPCRFDRGPPIWGPGTLDMKAGVAMAFTALELLDRSGPAAARNRAPAHRVTRRSAAQSRGRSPKAGANTCDAVYVLEPAQGLAYKTARKGTGNWRIEVKGLAAHAGVDFRKRGERDLANWRAW